MLQLLNSPSPFCKKLFQILLLLSSENSSNLLPQISEKNCICAILKIMPSGCAPRDRLACASGEYVVLLILFM